MTRYPPVPFTEIAEMAAARADEIVPRWLPNGKRMNHEWVACNPTRADNNPGSFSICVYGDRAGRWADFAVNDSGGDLISLYKYLFGGRMVDAARIVAGMVGHEFAGYRG